MFESWNNRFPNQTEGALISHCNSLLEQNKYYYKQFSEEGRYSYHTRDMIKASSIFNPLHIEDIDYVRIVTDLYCATDKLVHFGYTNFSQSDLCNNLKYKFLMLWKRQNEIMNFIGYSLSPNKKHAYKI